MNILDLTTTSTTGIAILKLVAVRLLPSGNVVLKSMFSESMETWERFLQMTFKDEDVTETDHVIAPELFNRLQEISEDSDDIEAVCTLLDDLKCEEEEEIIKMMIDIVEHSCFTIEIVARKLSDFNKDEILEMAKMAEPEVYFKAHI